VTQVPNEAADNPIAGVDDRAAFVTNALREAEALGPNETISQVEQLSGGWSRHSHIAHTSSNGAGDRQFIIRVEAPGGVLETDIAAEYALYHALDDEPEIRTPRVYYFDGTGDNPFGHRLMIMQHVAGRAANAFRRGDRAWLEQDWNGPKGIATDMVENLARLHNLPLDRMPAGTIPELGFLDVVDRWQAVYEEKRLVRDPVT